MLFGLVVIGLMVEQISTQVPFFGKCPNVTTKQDFDAEQYMGRWYEIERYFAIFEFGGKCVTATYRLNSNGEVGVTNQQISAFTGLHSTIEGVGNTIDRSDDARLAVKFPSLPVQFAAPYWVLDTDYNEYAVVWSCNEFGIFSTQNAWILTRSNRPSLDAMEKAYKVLDRNLITRAYFIRTDQVNCPI